MRKFPTNGRLLAASLALCFAIPAFAQTEPGGSADEALFPCAAPDEVERVVTFYEDQTSAHPRLYPAWALLGKARLDKVRWTGNPADLEAARKAIRRSLDIQPNLNAFVAAAAAANYGHRFKETLTWCDRAAKAAPGLPDILSLRVEALLALGRPDEALEAVKSQSGLRDDYSTAACRAMCLARQGDRAGALVAFRDAADKAQAAKQPQLAAWALVSAAGACLDSGHADDAVPFVEDAQKLAPHDPAVIIHLAELDVARGQLETALKRYEDLLARQCNPELHRRCFVLCRRLGRDGEAHFMRAEQMWRTALKQGEAYPLEGLANLYCDARRHLDEAVQLAEKNLEYKQDPAALATRTRARQFPKSTK